MKKKIIAVFALLFLSAFAAYAALSDEDYKADLTPKSLKDDAFVVATDETSSADSMNRVSGQYDRGFSSPEQSYKSEHTTATTAHSPMDRAAVEESAQQNNS